MKRALRQLPLVAAAALLLTGCIPGGVLTNKKTVDPDTVAAIYVPTNQYDNWNCNQINGEIKKTEETIADMGDKLRKGEYDKSGTLIVTPIGIMYDNTTMMDDTPKKTQEFGRLKGVLQSLKEASAKARCPAV